MEYAIDIKENNILKKWPELLELLLRDRTTQKNIFWATDIYEKQYGKNHFISSKSAQNNSACLSESFGHGQ